ncbi:chromobox protein homolog 3 isoform X1 [Rhizophagus irregularis DAOM 181602=DAOM 197198]|nr:chromobox protein homolog 3 isoform X1 [Rhizophagus irregularis DAOM 181602=DAOM 197198]
MSHLENYYKYYNLSGVPARILKASTSSCMETKCDASGRSRRDASRPQRIPLFSRSGRSRGRNRIKPPTHRMETDSGSEFTNDQVRDFFLNSLGVMMRFGEPGRHKQQSYAERAIQAIQEPLLKRMVAQELKTGVTSVEWSEDFHDVVNKIDEIWQRNSPDIPTGSPKVSKKTELLSEGTHGIPISVYPDVRQPERFVPERILRHRIRKGQDQYLVKWERYPDTEATWEPADRLEEDVPALIRKFWE